MLKTSYITFLLQCRAYSNGAVQPGLFSPKSRMCSPSCKIVQSKICALNFHTNQQQDLFPHLLHLQRWQVGTGNLFILQVGGVYRISQSVAGLQRLTVFRNMPYSDKTSASKEDNLIRKFWLKNFF